MKQCKYQNKGFVLISTLCLLMVMTLLTLASFEQSRLQLQMAQSVIQYHEIQTQLLFQLDKVEQELLLNDNLCQIPTTIMNDYPEQSSTWWRQRGCILSDKPFQTRYVNESISEDICEQKANGRSNGLIFHRITVMVLNNHGQNFLQTVLVQPTKLHKNCKRWIQLQHYGRQGLLWG